MVSSILYHALDTLREAATDPDHHAFPQPEWMRSPGTSLVDPDDSDALYREQTVADSRYIAVGYFYTATSRMPLRRGWVGDDACGIADEDDRVRFPDGRNVRAWLVADNSVNAVTCPMSFRQAVLAPSGASGRRPVQPESRRRAVRSMCAQRAGLSPNPTVVLCERCYHYLKYWLDITAAAGPGPGLSFPGELYEIVNSQYGWRTCGGAYFPACVWRALCFSFVCRPAARVPSVVGLRRRA